MSTTSSTPQKKPDTAAADTSTKGTKAPAKAPATKQKAGTKPGPVAPGLVGPFLILGLILGALVYFFGIAPRETAKTQLDQEQKLSMDRHVAYAAARLATPKSELPLPGTVEAFQQASIYARTTGYVKRWLVDIGDHVKQGDLLAELDTPEVDQQLSQAQSTAAQAKAAVDIAQTAADRWNSMLKEKAVSQQEADEKNATLKEATATYEADAASVRQLNEQENFKQIRAPFAGTITYRHIEVGNLVTAGTGTAATGTTELFRIAQTDPLRVFVDVPEANAPSLVPGTTADIHVQAYPDRVFLGNVVRNAGALDNASRTLKTEIHVPNQEGLLLPGSYADVRLELFDKKPTVLIPANTLIVNSAGTQVALLESVDAPDKDKYKVHLLPVKVGRDFGTEVEILQNVKEGDRLVANPPADLNEGAVVTGKPVPTPPAPPIINPPQKS